MMSYLLLTFFCAFIQCGNVVYSKGHANRNETIEHVNTAPNANKKFSAILFLAETPLSQQEKKFVTQRSANFVDPLKFLKFTEIARVKKCTSHLESKVGDTYKNIIQYTRDTCNCDDLMSNSLKNAIEYCRNNLKMTTAVITVTNDSVDSDIRFQNSEMHEAILKQNAVFPPAMEYGDVQVHNNNTVKNKGGDEDPNLPFNNLDNTPVPMDNREKGDTSNTNGALPYNASSSNNSPDSSPMIITGVVPTGSINNINNEILNMPVEEPQPPQPEEKTDNNHDLGRNSEDVGKNSEDANKNIKFNKRLGSQLNHFEIVNLEENDNINNIQKNDSLINNLRDSFSSDNQENIMDQPSFRKITDDDDLFPIFEMFGPPRELAFNNINRWNRRSKAKREVITEPEHSEWFNFGNKNKRHSLGAAKNDDILKRKQFNPKGRSLFDMFNLMEMIRNSLIGDLFVRDTGRDSENNVDPNLIGQSAEVSMLRTVRNTLNKIQDSPSGFLMVVSGGLLDQLRDSQSNLLQTIKFVVENTDESKTLVVLTGNCPKEITSEAAAAEIEENADDTSSTPSTPTVDIGGKPKKRQNIQIPVYARGPNVFALSNCSELYDIPLAIKSFLEKTNGDKTPIRSRRRSKRSLPTETKDFINIREIGSSSTKLSIADFVVIILLFIFCL